MFELENDYSAKGNVPAIKQYGGHPLSSHVFDTIPLFDRPYTVVLGTGSRLPTLLLLIPEAQSRAKRPV
jgi:hypothetical protein